MRPSPRAMIFVAMTATSSFPAHAETTTLSDYVKAGWEIKGMTEGGVPGGLMLFHVLSSAEATWSFAKWRNGVRRLNPSRRELVST